MSLFQFQIYLIILNPECYFGEGELTDDPLNTFGTRAVAKVPNLQELMKYVCNHGYEHHVVMNASRTADILY